MLRILVSKTGKPLKVEVDSSSGNSELDEAAVAAGWKASFSPAIQNGQPVECETTVPVSFRLE